MRRAHFAYTRCVIRLCGVVYAVVIVVILVAVIAVVAARHTRVHRARHGRGGGGPYISALGELPGAALSLSDVTNAAFNATSR